MISAWWLLGIIPVTWYVGGISSIYWALLMTRRSMARELVRQAEDQLREQA